MGASFVLPLYPLEEVVLLPGVTVSAPPIAGWLTAVTERSRAFGGAVIASLADGDSVHEIGVTAMLETGETAPPRLRGIVRCRLLELVDTETPLVRAERFPDPTPATGPASRIARLLRAHADRLYRGLGAGERAPNTSDLSTLTWQLIGGLGLGTEQQQGFLNVPDAVTRGRLLLVAIRELEKRERFLRPWAHLRPGSQWN